MILVFLFLLFCVSLSNAFDNNEITVEITYSIDSDLFDSLAANGTSFSDGSEFEQALAGALGLNTTDIVVSAVTGTLTIEYVVSDEATGDDPLTQENLQALVEVESELTTITNTVLAELGLSENDITSNSIDYCTDRDCNGRGTCDSSTGVCTCTDTNYWGVNCETLVNCNDGIKDPEQAYCICQYPQFGQRCENTKDCTCGSEPVCCMDSEGQWVFEIELAVNRPCAICGIPP
jgi:hypothetical protein